MCSTWGIAHVGKCVVLLHAGTISSGCCFQAQTNPEDVGVLLAPPGAALLLMATFFVYRFASKDDFDY